ncbi:MAG TPA: hypothetical protein EYG67_04395 [Campylobacterales bacterium]|nr:hypothetical protein [Campylobacterales bacterium]HIP41682.1 hypothetical protein [Campylobacterales bacterium]
MENNIALIVFSIIGLIIFANMVKIFLDSFSNKKRYKEIYRVRGEITEKVRPYLGSLEKKFKNDKNAEKFGVYVYEQFKDKLQSKNEKLIEKEICKCCSAYEGADCKEDFCLKASGIACDKR